MALRVPKASQIQAPAERPVAPVRRQGAPGIEAFGGGQTVAQGFEAVQNAVGTGIEIAAKEKKKAIDDEVTAIDIELSKAEAASKLAAQELHGKNAGGATQVGQDSFLKRYDEIVKDSSPAAKERAALLRDARLASLFKATEQHTSNERQKFFVDTNNAAVSQYHNEAVQNSMDDDIVDRSLALTEMKRIEFADRQGMDAKAKKALVTEAKSQVHKSVILRRVSLGFDKQARAWFDANRENLTPEHFDSVKAALEDGELRAESQRRTDEIMGLELDDAETRETARQIEDEKIRDETVRRINRRIAERKDEERQAEEDLFKEDARIALETGNTDGIDPGRLVEYKTTKRNLGKQLERIARDKFATVSNPKRFYKLKNMATEEPGKFAVQNLALEIPNFTEVDWKTILRWQTSARQRKGDAELDGYRSQKEIVDTELRNIGINPNPKESDDVDSDAFRVAAFRKETERRVMELQAATGKKATNKDIQLIVDFLKVKGLVGKEGPLEFLGPFRPLVDFYNVTGMLFGPEEKRVIELAEGDKNFSVKFDQIPINVRNEIERDIREAGGIASEEAVVLAFEHEALKGKGRGNR